MTSKNKEIITVPRFFRPLPHQVEAWKRRASGQYKYYFMVWARQCLAGDCLVWTTDGPVRVDELKDNDVLLTFDKKDSIITSSKCRVWETPIVKPIIEMRFENDTIRTSYDHKFYYNGTYQELYRIVWRALDANQRHKLQVLCEQYGQSALGEWLREAKPEDTVFDSEAVWSGQHPWRQNQIHGGATVLRRFQETSRQESPPVGSRSIHPESQEQEPSQPQGRRQDQQQSGELGMGNPAGEYAGFFGDSILCEQNNDSQYQGSLQAGPRFERRDVLSEDDQALWNNSKQHQIHNNWPDLGVCGAEQLYDISVPGTNNFFAGLNHVLLKNSGKDSTMLQQGLKRAWDNPGTQSVYIGLDNGWIRENIFKKYIDGRTHWMDYPEDLIEVKDTDRRVTMLNNPEGKAEATIKFIGFLNDQALIGSSYDFFQVSELSLYPQKAFRYIEPIWENKIAKDSLFEACFNSTPRGTHNLLYDMLKKYTGESEPEAFPGAHGNVYVDVRRVTDLTGADGKPWFSEEHLEEIKGRYMSEFGNLNMFNQEYMVDFLTVNAGLVYQGIEQLQRDGRYTDYNVNPSYPVYVAWDISSKGKMTDKTSMVAFQYYNGRMFLCDWYEEGGKALVECISEVSQRDWWKYVKLGILPWDSERSASSETPIEEAKAQWPNINWHALSMERVDRGIAAVRKLIPNMIIAKNENEYGEDRLMSAFNNYEYKYLTALDNWAAKPLHNWASHLMDAVRYAAMGINEIEYFQMQPTGEPQRVPTRYDAGSEPLAEEEFTGPIWAKPSKLAPRRREDDSAIEVIW